MNDPGSVVNYARAVVQKGLCAQRAATGHKPQSAASPHSLRLLRVFYLDTLKRQLPRITEGGSLASVLEHCMYCGMSLGRVGLDFRGLLVPVFEQEVLRLFSSSVKVCGVPLPSCAGHVWELSSAFAMQVSSGTCP